MTVTELIRANRGKVVDAMERAYRETLEADGAYAVQIYIWDDGEVETHDVVGHGDRLKSLSDDCDLHYLLTVRNDCFDWTEYVTEPVLPGEGKAVKAEVIETLCNDYNADDVLDATIAELEME